MMRFAGSLTTMTCVALGSIACATPAAGQALRHQVGGYDVEVLVDGAPVPTYAHNGETYVMGQIGDRYVVRVSNHSGRRIEAVVSIDGRDVIDGKPGDFRRNRGYLVPAWGSVDIDGWRVSTHAAAAFRFSSVADSYAARTGRAREVGVIGVAVFPERYYAPPPRPYYRPYYPYDDAPTDRSYESRRKSEDSAGRDESGAGGLYGLRGAPPAASSGAPVAPSASPASPPVAEAEKVAPYAHQAPSRRPGLGTEFGEAVSSPVREVEFVRANAVRPSVILGMRYNDRAGLVAAGIDVDNVWGPDDTYLRQTAQPFPVSQRGYATPPPGWRREW
jgi:hypothetical protein